MIHKTYVRKLKYKHCDMCMTFCFNPLVLIFTVHQSLGESLKIQLDLLLCSLPRQVNWGWGLGMNSFFSSLEDSDCCPHWDHWFRHHRVTWDIVTTWWQCCSLCLDGPAFFHPKTECFLPKKVCFLFSFFFLSCFCFWACFCCSMYLPCSFATYWMENYLLKWRCFSLFVYREWAK